ncbi:ornithine cyclodeaminase family protein [Streptomyces sp. NPDC048172]|uniref:ornithine cyclodeaminase family protein n=1 Tax=Streptomyces sp. NPDC048172 TaxID=3365505 RepID=UPI0037125082
MQPTEDLPPLLGGDALRALCPPAAAIDPLREALRSGLDPSTAPPRTHVPTSAGQLLLMPAEHGSYAGVKIAGVAPGNPALGLPRITGLYLLLDAATLRPLALLDGPQLTLTRTSAVSALAVDHLAAPDADRMLVHGTGPQALAHAAAVHAVRPLRRLDVVGRRPEAVAEFVRACAALGLPARAADSASPRGADLVVCCTSATGPLFDGAELEEHATVVAMGSHTPDARETDDATVRRATVVVEDVGAALREAGDIVIPHRAGLLPRERLHTLADLVTGRFEPPAGPRFFKSVGMAWQDLVVASRIHERSRDRVTESPAPSSGG